MKSVCKMAMALLLLMAFSVGCTKQDEPNHSENGDGNDTVVGTNDVVHDYVDLGLPRGTLWATCNVGADSPEEIGGYFAWGEIVPKEFYGWKNYRYGNCVDNRFEMTKYCTDSCWGLFGFVDSLIVLEPIDDAAMANWGNDWRMPTKEEWEELYLKTTWVWTTRNGVNGRLLTSWNGNSMFLPATGFYLDSEVICPGLGIYWSSTLHSHFPERGWSYHFDWESSHVCGTYERSRGQCVRAVRSSK